MNGVEDETRVVKRIVNHIHGEIQIRMMLEELEHMAELQTLSGVDISRQSKRFPTSATRQPELLSPIPRQGNNSIPVYQTISPSENIEMSEVHDSVGVNAARPTELTIGYESIDVRKPAVSFHGITSDDKSYPSSQSLTKESSSNTDLAVPQPIVDRSIPVTFVEKDLSPVGCINGDKNDSNDDNVESKEERSKGQRTLEAIANNSSFSSQARVRALTEVGDSDAGKNPVRWNF